MDNDPDYFQVNHVSLVLNPFIHKIPSKSKRCTIYYNIDMNFEILITGNCHSNTTRAFPISVVQHERLREM